MVKRVFHHFFGLDSLSPVADWREHRRYSWILLGTTSDLTCCEKAKVVQTGVKVWQWHSQHSPLLGTLTLGLHLERRRAFEHWAASRALYAWYGLRLCGQLQPLNHGGDVCTLPWRQMDTHIVTAGWGGIAEFYKWWKEKYLSRGPSINWFSPSFQQTLLISSRMIFVVQ